MPVNNNFFLKHVVLEGVKINNDSLTLEYLLDGDQLDKVSFRYNTICFDDPVFHQKAINSKSLEVFAAALGAFGILRYAALLPAVFDLRQYSELLSPQIVDFLELVIPGKWSEHRYQVQRMDYKHPEILVDSKNLKESNWPIWGIPETQKVLIASGSGKDSALCSLMLERAGISYDMVTYLYDLYGDAEDQDNLFSRASNKYNYNKKHSIQMDDTYFPWLEKRMQEFDITKVLKEEGPIKPFRVEAGEVYIGSLAMMPIQVKYDIALQLFGNEKSADACNLIDPESQEEVAHQWAKSIRGERALYELYNTMFSGMNRVSLTKHMHDVSIFDTLFSLDSELPYYTNSCNIQKPWCCRCEKCAYVFAGFVAFGDYEKVKMAFGEDMYNNSELLPIWKELMGLNNTIPWECVGHNDEVQYYLYKAWQKGIHSLATRCFVEAIWEPLVETKQEDGAHAHFQEVKRLYGDIYEDHHNMPNWLWDPIRNVIENSKKTA